jgi:hypothetical protein
MKRVLAAVAVLAASALPATAEESGPGAVLAYEDCAKLWNQAAGRSDLSADQAKAYVTSFDKVDTNHDKKISNSEFLDGCTAGLVHRAASSGSAN